MDIAMAGKSPTLAEKQNAMRAMRGVIETLARTLGGTATELSAIAASGPAAFDPGAFAELRVAGAAVGHLGTLSGAALQAFGLDIPLVAAEVELESLLALFPPRGTIAPLPAFPSVERDLSPILPENVTWEGVSRLVNGVRATADGKRIESYEFIGTYRGKQIGQGKKSLTLRLVFRDPARTLRHEEVDPEVGVVMQRLKAELGAEFRVG